MSLSMPLRLHALARQPFLCSIILCESNWGPVARTSRSFSGCTGHQTRQRQSMWIWLESQGKNFLHPLPRSTNYLGAYDSHGRLKRLLDAGSRDGQDNLESTSIQEKAYIDNSLPRESASDLMPFPQNRLFRSERVINEAMREDIWRKVMKDGLSVKTVSAQLGVEMSRVGAIVRLKEVEKQWVRQGKQLAKPYARAVMAMLPQTPYPYDQKGGTQSHESINDLPVHVATMQQIFHPTSESRKFTRTDAARIFDQTLLPADQRVPHPELADLERDRLAGIPYNERVAKAAKRNDELQQNKLDVERRRREKEESAVKVVSGPRWDFKFRDISVNDAGIDGRGHKGTGWRYGAPHMDRRKGEVKIPTRAE